MTIDGNDPETQSKASGTPNMSSKHGHDGEYIELSELEAEQVAGGLVSLNDKCLNAVKC
jgi:hypothetical protein